MNSILELLAGSWVALGFLKSSAIALIGGAFIFCLRQRDLAASLWAGLSLLLSLASFTGYAPADKPRYVVAVRMEGRHGGQKPFYGGTVAAPVAARLFQALLADDK